MKKVIPMTVKDSADPYVFNPNTGEFEMTNHVVQFTESGTVVFFLENIL